MASYHTIRWDGSNHDAVRAFAGMAFCGVDHRRSIVRVFDALQGCGVTVEVGAVLRRTADGGICVDGRDQSPQRRLGAQRSPAYEAVQEQRIARRPAVQPRATTT